MANVLRRGKINNNSSFKCGVLMRNAGFFRFIILASFFCVCRIAVATVPDIAERLNFLWRLHHPTNKHMSSSSSSEYNAYADDGQYWYVLANLKSDRVSFYRLYSSSNSLYKDSTLSSETGYAYDATLGYAYTQQEPGTTEIKQWYRSSPLDYAIYRPSEPTLTGYTLQLLPASVYAYPRYGASDSSNMLSLTGGGVTIQSNRAAGGAIFSWVHNGKEYININDYGREMQSAYFASYSDNNGSWSQINPTEAGSYSSFQNTAVALRQGSPVETAYNNGLTQITRSIPLDFNPGPNPNTTVDLGGDDYHPILWPTCRLGKNITLNYNNMGPVAKYETYVVAPADTYSAGLEIPTAYLTGDFTNFWSYDAATHTLTSKSVTYNSGVELMPASGFGGVIISTSSNNYAMGVYGVSAQYGGSAAAFALYNFSYGYGSHTDSYTTKWAVGGARAGLDASKEYIFTTWVMSGTLAEVQGYMDALYAANVVGAPKITSLDPNTLCKATDDIVVFKPATKQWLGSYTGTEPNYLNGLTATSANFAGDPTRAIEKALLGDVNGDGIDDLVVLQNYSGNYDWLALHSTVSGGVGSFGTPHTSAPYYDSWMHNFGTIAGNLGCFLADMNGDGKKDIVTVNAGYGWYSMLSTNGLGGGAFTGPVYIDRHASYVLPRPNGGVQTGDFDGDGQADICFVCSWDGTNARWIVKKTSGGVMGAGVQAEGFFGYGNDGNDIFLVGDINGDGRDDGIWVHPNTTTGLLHWAAKYADPNGQIGGNPDYTGDTYGDFGLVGDKPFVIDLDGDGRMDIGYTRNDGNGGLLWRVALTTRSGALTNFATAGLSTVFGATGDIPLAGRLHAVMPGDVNRDGSVTAADLQAFIAAWLSTPRDAGWNKNCEMALPKDGRINLKDFAVLAGNWLAGTN